MKDGFTKKWITANSLELVRGYDKGILTIRGLHYRLVALGMTNDVRHYKRVVDAMIDARWNGSIDFDTFSDHDRFMLGKTEYENITLEEKIEEAKNQVYAWMTSYTKNKWLNQYYYPEVLIEKKALQGVFKSICSDWRVTLGACKGYPSLTFLYDISRRLIRATNNGYQPVILYLGDYDPSGEDIPRSIQENLIQLGSPNVEIRRIALNKEQVNEMGLPPAPIKISDTRSSAWTGIGQVELDAIDPHTLQSMCNKAIQDLYQPSIAIEIMSQTKREETQFRDILKQYASTL